MNQTVLVVDDEERIRSSLRGILSDEGFHVVDTGNATDVMGIVERENPSVVLLDVWMPEIDGIELLRRIKSERPNVPVIMISGHANIQNAVAATKLGAADFIQKPFSVTGLLAAIARVIEGGNGGRVSVDVGESADTDTSSVPASSVAARGGRRRRQRTIARSIVFGGQGLHTGLRTGVILHPAPAGFGIVFASLSDETQIPVQLENVTDTGYNTTLASGGRSVRTVEHLMSALHGFGITNLLVKTDDEIPALDGSAAEFCRQLAEVGIKDQDATVQPIRIREPITVGTNGAGKEFITIEPADHLTIDYNLDYPAPVGVQNVHFEMTSTESYVKEIAPARTFLFVRDYTKLASMGLASGGRLDNVILVDDQKIVNTKLRFPEEFARHKVLDLMGDLYLLGRPIEGHVTASKTGHSDNLALVKAIRASLAN